MTSMQDDLLFGFWTGLMVGCAMLWVYMFALWWGRRDIRALLYALLFMHLWIIFGINAVIRGSVLPISPPDLIAIQRGLWVTVMFVLVGMVDIYRAEHYEVKPMLTVAWLWLKARREGRMKHKRQTEAIHNVQ